MFAQPLRFVFAVENRELREHAHVRALEAEARLEQLDERLVVSARLIVFNELLELVGVHDNVETADLSESKLVLIDARKADLLPRSRRVGFAARVNCALIVAHLYDRYGETRVVADRVVENFRRRI